MRPQVVALLAAGQGASRTRAHAEGWVPGANGGHAVCQGTMAGLQARTGTCGYDERVGHELENKCDPQERDLSLVRRHRLGRREVLCRDFSGQQGGNGA